jgi:hypothetical protein
MWEMRLHLHRPVDIYKVEKGGRRSADYINDPLDPCLCTELWSMSVEEIDEAVKVDRSEDRLHRTKPLQCLLDGGAAQNEASSSLSPSSSKEGHSMTGKAMESSICWEASKKALMSNGSSRDRFTQCGFRCSLRSVSWAGSDGKKEKS